MTNRLTVRRAITKDAIHMANILREIGWSERRNSLPMEEVSGPIAGLIEHVGKDNEGHTVLVVEDENGEVLGFINVHWIPFIMLGSCEGYVSDVFVSPKASGRGVGSLLLESIMKEGENRGCMRLMVTNGKEKLSYKSGFYKKMGWTERPKVANFVYYYREPWS